MLSGADQSILNRFLALMEANQNGRLTVQIYPDADAPSDEASTTAAARLLAVRRYLISQAGGDHVSRQSECGNRRSRLQQRAGACGYRIGPNPALDAGLIHKTRAAD